MTVPGWELAKCGTPDCSRLVKAGVKHCCMPCAGAAAGQYEIDEHSDGCERRHAERGDVKEVL